MSTKTSFTCIVSGCRHPNSHVALGHECGTCHQLGHGTKECTNASAKEQLIKNIDYNKYLSYSDQCTVLSCYNKNFHKTIGHKCEQCKQFGHDAIYHQRPSCDCCSTTGHPQTSHPITNCPTSKNIKHIQYASNVFKLPIKDYITDNISFRCRICNGFVFSDACRQLHSSFSGTCVKCNKRVDAPIEFNCAHGACITCFKELVLDNFYDTDNPISSVIQGFPIPASLAQLIINKFKHVEFDYYNKKGYAVFDAGMGCLFYAKRENGGSLNLEIFFMHSDSWGQYGPTTDHRPFLAHFLYGSSLIK